MAGIDRSWPLVSVIIPAHNHERYIHRCLDSVLQDSYANKELVIINDGSTDRTHERIAGWIEQHHLAIDIDYVSRENRGLTHSLNELITRFRGEYVVPLASDDCLLNGGIMRRVRYLERHTEKLAVFGDCIVIDEKDDVLYDSGLSGLYSARLDRYSSDGGLMVEIISRWAVPGPVLMVNRSIYDVIGLYDTNLTVEDWDFYLRMVSKNLLGYTNHKVSAYRLHDSSNIHLGRRKLFMYQELLKTAGKNVRLFRGRGKRLLVRQIIILLYLIARHAIRRSK